METRKKYLEKVFWFFSLKRKKKYFYGFFFLSLVLPFLSASHLPYSLLVFCFQPPPLLFFYISFRFYCIHSILSCCSLSPFPFFFFFNPQTNFFFLFAFSLKKNFLNFYEFFPFKI